jgi:Cys-tRNA(Pro)/Cys-tRNA(Cys) deacylase
VEEGMSKDKHTKLAEEKTNVMRILDGRKIKYNHYCYAETGETNGVKVAQILGQDPDKCFKTLVTVAKSGANYVFVIPVNKELDLKKAAKAVREKSIEMLKAKDLLPLTGYIHGGCSPIGMKKFFKTTVNQSAENLKTIYVSAGKVGYQVEINPKDLAKVIRYEFADVVCE